MKNAVRELVDKLEELSGTRIRPSYNDGVCPFELLTTVSKKGKDIQPASIHHVPDDIRELWNEFDEIRLFEDDEFGQWGLHLYDELQARSATDDFIEDRKKDYRPGDIVVGEFLGDSDLLILRSDSSETDFGSVLIALPLDSRSEWYRPSKTLIKFITRYMESEGEKFWESNS